MPPQVHDYSKDLCDSSSIITGQGARYMVSSIGISLTGAPREVGNSAERVRCEDEECMEVQLLIVIS